ncbi:MAG: hypothetical protein KAH03_07365 [Cocleimonas sp.]|nr:hypothetical protein [Cocleimonas sp.]
MTIDRMIHLAVGIAFFALFFKLSKTSNNSKLFITGLITMAVGTWMPDWDLWLGIGYHRSPLTHSALPAILFGIVVFKSKLSPMLLIGFCLGLASHLFWDIIAYGNVHWIKGGNNDRLFLFVNTVLLIIAVIVVNHRYFGSQKVK